MRWTKAFRKSHGKDLSVDSTFEFERRRNRPIKYDRELMGATLRAMKRIEEIRLAREARFKLTRKVQVSGRKRAEALREIKQGLHLLINPLVRRREELAQQASIRTGETLDQAAAASEAITAASEALEHKESMTAPRLTASGEDDAPDSIVARARASARSGRIKKAKKSADMMED